jgi:hypothetical protein
MRFKFNNVLPYVKQVRWTPISGHPEANLSYGGGVWERCISSGSRNQGLRGLVSAGSAFWNAVTKGQARHEA